MSVIELPVVKKPIKANPEIPGSKSITNRVLVIASLMNRPVRVRNVLVSDGSMVLMESLKNLGVKIFLDSENKILTLESKGKLFEVQRANLYLGNSGTSVRFMTVRTALSKGTYLIDGNDRMRERPIDDLVNALRSLGVSVSYKLRDGFPPVVVKGIGHIRGGKATVCGKKSSQFVSAILLSAPYFDKGVDLLVREVVSKPFMSMTLKIMEKFGADVKEKESTDGVEYIVSQTEYSLDSYIVEPDATNSFYFLVLPLILGGEVRVDGIGKQSVQGDVKFVEVLERMGAGVDIGNDFVRVEGDGKIKGGFEIDMNEFPDLVQTLAVLSLFADAPVKITDIANLRIKETDRISALENELTKLGAKVKAGDDFIEIEPSRTYKPAEIETYDDHRMAMSFALAGLKIEGLKIKNPECVSKTFPEFWSVLSEAVGINL